MPIYTLYEQLVSFAKKQNIKYQYPANQALLRLLKQGSYQIESALEDETRIVIGKLSLFEDDNLCPVYLAQLIENLKSYSWFLAILKPAGKYTKRLIIKQLASSGYLHSIIHKMEHLDHPISTLEDEVKMIITEETMHFFGWEYNKYDAVDMLSPPTEPAGLWFNSPAKYLYSSSNFLFRPSSCYSNFLLGKMNFFTLSVKQSTVVATMPNLSMTSSEVD